MASFELNAMGGGAMANPMGVAGGSAEVVSVPNPEFRNSSATLGFSTSAAEAEPAGGDSSLRPEYECTETTQVIGVDENSPVAWSADASLLAFAARDYGIYIAARTGRKFWRNRLTGETQWEKPTGETALQEFLGRTFGALSRPTIDRTFEQVDADKSGQITGDEFFTWFEASLGREPNVEDNAQMEAAMDVFEQLDTDGSGALPQRKDPPRLPSFAGLFVS